MSFRKEDKIGREPHPEPAVEEVLQRMQDQKENMVVRMQRPHRDTLDLLRHGAGKSAIKEPVPSAKISLVRVKKALVKLNVGRRVRPVIGNLEFLSPIEHRIILRESLLREKCMKPLRLSGLDQQILIHRGPKTRHRVEAPAEDALHHDRIETFSPRSLKEQQELIGLCDLPHRGGEGLCLPLFPILVIFVRDQPCGGIKNKRQDALFRRSCKDFFKVSLRE